jgi:hypothetical protein
MSKLSAPILQDSSHKLLQNNGLPKNLGLILTSIQRATSNEIDHSFLVKSFKLVPRPLGKSLGSRQIKLWLWWHHFGGKTNWSWPKKQSLKESSLFEEPKCNLGFKVVHFFVFIFIFILFFLSFSLKFWKNERRVVDWGHCRKHTNSPVYYQF